MRAEATWPGGGGGQWREAREPVALLAVMAVLAGCAGPGLDKAGGTQARQPVVLTLANFIGQSVELDGFAGEVRRLSAGTMRIDIRSRWRRGQVDSENGLIGDVRRGEGRSGRCRQPGLGLRRRQQLPGA